MSRIGKQPVAIPAGVTVSVNGSEVAVKGKLGELKRTFHEGITVSVEGSEVIVKRADDSRVLKSCHGLTRALLNNMVVGTTQGFAKNLEIVGVGYRAQLTGTALTLNLGYSHPIVVNPPENITFECPTPNKIVVKGIDKQVVGQVAADIRAKRSPEPYKGKGIRYEGENVRRKEGKTGK